jgi:2-octaprenyl-6-methoxyphenol hydroxylase
MTFDVIIIGGGMVGASLACALHKRHHTIALIDSAPLNLAEDERLIALNDGSTCLFENIGIWPHLKPHAAAIQQVHVSHLRRFGITRIHAKDLGLTALGHVVPAKYINSALNETLKTIANVTVLRPAKLESLEQDETGVNLTISTTQSNQTLRAKQVVGADGSFSTVRRLLNIAVEKVDYQQSALVTVTQLQRDHQHIAYERFLQNGAIAMLPLTQQRAATIWSDQHDNIAHLMSLSDEAFIATLQKQFGYRLGRLQGIGKRAVYPLQMLHAKEQQKQHVTLIGNALHTVHPLAAQGLNLALYEVALLAENPPHLLFDKGWMGGIFKGGLGDKLNWLFSTDLFLLNQARQLAMLGLDILPPVKNLFAQYAMGKIGQVPDLLIRKDH